MHRIAVAIALALATSVAGATHLVADIDSRATACTFFIAYKANPLPGDYGPAISVPIASGSCSYLVPASFPVGVFTFKAQATYPDGSQPQSAGFQSSKPGAPTAPVAVGLVGSGTPVAIALGQTAKKTQGAGGVSNPLSTTGVTTSASGSTFVALMDWIDSQTFTSFTDTINGSASGNTWTQIGVERDSGTGAADGAKMRAYIAQNANGGTNHVFSLQINAVGNGLMNVWVMEVTGAAASSLDQSIGLLFSATSPMNSGSTGTTAQAAEMIVGLAAGNNDSGTGSATIVSSGSNPADANWSVAVQESNSASFFTGGLAYAIVNATGAYNFSYTTGDATQGYSGILTLKQAPSNPILSSVRPIFGF